MTREPALAEDLTQDIFLHLSRKIHLFKGAAAFRTWLHSITVNIVLMYFRHHKRSAVSLDNEKMAPITAGLSDNASGLDIDTRISLGEALLCLPPQRRRVLVLHDMEGYRHKDISQLLGITPGASRCQLHHARSKLRAGLAQGLASPIRRPCSLSVQSSSPSLQTPP
jgi:RNA polymerase sigma factor (sigma-70 family)